MAVSFKARIARVQKKLKSVNGAMIVSSAPVVMSSRDTAYPYRQNSDFYYLTGSEERDFTLFLSAAEKRPLLFAPAADPKRAIWEGNGEDPKDAAKRIGAECITGADAATEISARLKGCEVLYHQNIEGTSSKAISGFIRDIPSHRRRDIPSRFELADAILVPMRLYKDAEEVRMIKKAAAITQAAIDEVLPYVAPGVPERFIQATFDYWVRVYGGEPAFTTIVGTGPSAAILHYEKCTRTAKQGDLLMIDCGASFQYYCSDITRVFPVSGYFEGPLGDLYAIILEAQKAAMKKIRHGVKVGSVYDAAARVMIDGLLYLGVLRGKASKLFSDKAYLPYFPHGIGHPLGIDVHDVGNIRGNPESILEEGMVITVEPGLYFAKKAGKLPACGVRIEDDVLVTQKGCETLTEFPKEMGDIEAVMATDGDLEVVI